ncbi:MAG TPA: D-alanyl-D-alanine carboxypeptidase family protein [Stellaceae bacterium]|nr:D-alanyl-D-alanine carboxypeptidase family protein [Stellaceae bacterium]
MPRFSLAVVLPLLAGVVAPPAPAAAAPAASLESAVDTQASHAYIEEVETGAVLLDKSGDDRLYPASMNKMMTAYVVFGMLKDGRAKLDQRLLVSRRAWKLGGSKMFVPVGGQVSIDELLQGALVQSGNDACLVLAQGLAGSEAGFVKLMNEKAKQIGLTGSHFDDVTGLPNPNDWMTAHDLARVAIHTIKDFPQYYHYYSQPSFTFNNITQQNRNPLLYKNVGADGLKTGHTDVSGYSLTASAKQGERRIVIVLSGLPTKKALAEESERLVKWAFREFRDYRLFAKGDKVDEADVWLGAKAQVPLSVAKDLVVTLPPSARPEMKVTINYDSPIAAPITKGEEVGTITVTAPGVAPVKAPLVAGAGVGRMGPLGRVATLAGYLIWGNRP